MTDSPPAIRFAYFAPLYLVSGALGLVYEVAFSKYLALIFGATAQASSVVLVAFMGGLAAGSALAARFERWVQRPLVTYGAIELGIAASVLLAPAAFAALGSLYPRLAAGLGGAALLGLRGSLGALVVALPALGMGATLPVVSRWIAGSAIAGRRLALLYAANTLGGAIGSLAATYWVLPTLGLSTTLQLGATLSALIGALAIALGRRVTVAGAASPPGPELPRDGRSGRGVAFASGLAVFAAEVCFVHLTAVTVGTSVYAFGLLLAVFLGFLGLGAALAPSVARRGGPAVAREVAVCAALALLVSVSFWDQLPLLFAGLGRRVVTFGGRECVRGLAIVAVLALPVTLMGMVFPLLIAAAGSAERPARAVGLLTAWNTLGSIVGSVAAGFVLLPRFGSQRSLEIVALGYVLAALAGRASPSLRLGLLGAAAAALALLGPRWNMERLTSGSNVYFSGPGERVATVIWIREDVHGGVTTVTESRDRRVHTLWTNGKFQGDDAGEMGAQQTFGHLPALFAPRHDRALLVGVGTGVTARTLAAYPFASIDVAELSPAIVEAATTFFTGINGRVFDDPRVHVVHEDGRALLATARTPYDVVTIELTSIWFAGAASLYTRDFYRVARAHLRDDGVLQQWVQLHHTTPREVARILASARAVFPHAALFVSGSQGHLLASPVPIARERSTLLERMAWPRVRAELGEPDVDRLLAGLVLDEDAIAAYVRWVAEREGLSLESLVCTDDDGTLEYATPRNNVLTASGATEATFQPFRAAVRRERLLDAR